MNHRGVLQKRNRTDQMNGMWGTGTGKCQTKNRPWSRLLQGPSRAITADCITYLERDPDPDPDHLHHTAVRCLPTYCTKCVATCIKNEHCKFYSPEDRGGQLIFTSR